MKKQNESTSSPLESGSFEFMYHLMEASCDNPNFQDEKGDTFLHKICRKSHPKLKILQFFLEIGLDPEIKNKQGNTCLHDLLENKELITTEQNLSIEMIKLLLKKIQDPNITNNHGNTFLHTLLVHSTSKNLNLDLIRLLLDYGVEPNIGNQAGHPSLYLACSKYGSHTKLIELLMEKKADPLFKTTDNANCLLIALVRDSEKNKKTPVAFIQLLLNNKIDPALSTNRHGFNSLHFACKQDNQAACELLIHARCDPQQVNYGGNTCLHFHLCTKFFNLSMIQFLIENGVDAKAVNINGHTCLDFALKYGVTVFKQNLNLDGIRLLLEQGCEAKILGQYHRAILSRSLQEKSYIVALFTLIHTSLENIQLFKLNSIDKKNPLSRLIDLMKHHSHHEEICLYIKTCLENRSVKNAYRLLAFFEKKRIENFLLFCSRRKKERLFSVPKPLQYKILNHLLDNGEAIVQSALEKFNKKITLSDKNLGNRFLILEKLSF